MVFLIFKDVYSRVGEGRKIARLLKKKTSALHFFAVSPFFFFFIFVFCFSFVVYEAEKWTSFDISNLLIIIVNHRVINLIGRFFYFFFKFFYKDLKRYFFFFNAESLRH